MFDKILHSKDQNLENAKKVLQRIISRDLYKLLGEKTGGKDENENKYRSYHKKLKADKVKPKVQDIFYSCNWSMDHATIVYITQLARQYREYKALISKWKTELTQELPEELAPEDFEVMPITFDYGMKEQNPFESIYFYTKENNTVASKMPEEKRPKLVTNDFSEKVIRFYFKRTDEKSLKSAKDHFAEWMKKQVQPNPTLQNSQKEQLKIFEDGN